MSAPIAIERPPLLALSAGDPAGIGPELIRAVLREPGLSAVARLLAVGPETEAPPGVTKLSRFEEWDRETPAWLVVPGGGWRTGVASRASGQAALEALRMGAELAAGGAVDGLVTAPVSKEALHLAGEHVEGQTELLGRWSGAPRVEMLACVRRLRVMPLTRHRPLADAVASLDTALVHDGLRFLDGELRGLGFAAPRLALAGLNPHAGEGGLFGDDEALRLRPACEAAVREGLDVAGPLPADSVFLRAAQGEFDAVLALYHDQAFIPVKLHAPGEAVTVLLGLPYLRVSPAHGTAFDIAGTGRADPANTRHAVRQAATWAQRRRSSSTSTASGSATATPSSRASRSASSAPSSSASAPPG